MERQVSIETDESPMISSGLFSLVGFEFYVSEIDEGVGNLAFSTGLCIQSKEDGCLLET